ncbi:MAG: hypothetical protein ACHP9Z_05625 [Streptosporangiales bacterium]
MAVPLDEDTIRLANGANLATVVTLTGTDYQRPIGPDGRIILKVAPSTVNTPKSLGR